MYTLEIKTSGSYALQYDHLNSHRDVGKYEVITSVPILPTDDDDPCEPAMTYNIVRVESDEDEDTIRRALCQMFSHSSCRHEYDCCGCRTTVAHKWNVNPRYADQWTVITNSSRNY